MKYLIIILLLISPTLHAQKYIKLYQNPDDYRKKAVRLYPNSNNNSTNNKAIIVCPGGSYCYLAKQNEGFSPAQMFTEHQFNSYTLIYRRGMRGNRYPAQIQDLQMAIHYLKTNFAQYNTIGICGFSAGGHLCGTAATYFNKDFNNIFKSQPIPKNYFRPEFAIMIYPVITMYDTIAHKKSRRNLLGQYYTQQQKDSLSIERHTHPDMPPIFIINCKDDPIVNYQNSVIYTQALTNTGIKHYYKLYPHGGHGFGIQPQRIKNPDKSAALWYNDFFNFLEEL